MSTSNINPAFPTKVTPSLEARHTTVLDERADDKALHYSLSIPVNWRQLRSDRSTVVSATDFLELARYGSTENSQAGITVSTLKLVRECGASEWLAIDQKRRSQTLLERRDQYTSSGSIPDVLTVAEGRDGQTIYRATVLKDGARLLKLECRAPFEAYSALAEAFLIAIVSFRFIHPKNEPCAELLQEYPVIGGKRVRLPNSWKLISGSASCIAGSLEKVQGKSWEFETTAGGRWAGTLIVACVSANPKANDQLRNSYLESLRSQGLHWSRLNVSRVRLKDSGFSEGWLFEPELSRGVRAEYSTPFLILMDEVSAYLLAMISMDSESHPEWYAICKRAFEIARDSLTVLDTE